jgi:deoxycytidylate deaminase
MGIVTGVTQGLQFGSVKDKRKLVDDNNETGGKPSWTSESFPYLTTGRLWGALTLQDRSRNRHAILFSATGDDTRVHTEIALLDNLSSWIKGKKIGLSTAKVIVYVDQSPCTECSKVLVPRSREIALQLGGGSGNFEFSYVFKQYYAKDEGDNTRHNLHKSAEATWDCYHKDINGVYGTDKMEYRILVRPIEMTKAGGGRHMSFKTAFQGI